MLEKATVQYMITYLLKPACSGPPGGEEMQPGKYSLRNWLPRLIVLLRTFYFFYATCHACVSRSLVTPVFHLLRSALDALGTWVHVVIVLIHGHASGPGVFSRRVDGVESEVLHHGIWRWHLVDLSWGQYPFEGLSGFLSHGAIIRTGNTLGEFDVELNVEVTKIVVAI